MRIQPTTVQLRNMQSATSFAQLKHIALRLFNNRLNMFSIICGPISTGGNVQQNILRFDATIDVIGQHIDLFDQMPWEEKLGQLKKQWENLGNLGYCYPLLTEFYEPLFRSGKIKRAYFLPGYKESVGASWEEDLCKKLRIEIMYLPETWFENMDPYAYPELFPELHAT